MTRSQVNYLIALFRIARGRAIPFGYLDQQDETVKLVRFTEDRLGVSFLAHRHSDKQAIFSLAAIGINSVALAVTVCTPKNLTFTDNLSSAWDVHLSENTGIFSGATYNLDTSNGYWRQTLAFGNGVNGYAASITWLSDIIYVPLHPAENINIAWSVQMRWVASNTSQSIFPLQLLVFVGESVYSGTTHTFTGKSTEWQSFSSNFNFTNYVVGTPIKLGLARFNSSIVGDYNAYSITLDIRNFSATFNVTCG